MATIPIRWSDNTKDLTKNLKEGLNQIEATKASVDKLVQSLSGDKLVASAHRWTAAIAEMGGVAKISASDQERAFGTITKAIEALERQGKAVPAAMRGLSDELERAQRAGGGMSSTFSTLGSDILKTAAGFVTAQAIIGAFKGAISALGSELVTLTVHGAAVADVTENFDHMTASTGRLGATLLGALRDGTHGTITDFELMKTANQDLAAGLNLTDAQFKTLAKGAFALAQATGGDVKTALDTMNDAMVTGKAKSLALLTGKVDLEAAEKQYAATLGTTADRLSDAGKVEAARVGILDAVSAATARLGDQTDGLDERIAQAQTAWANFQNELGRTVATSPVLMEALEGIKDILSDAFGSSQKDLVIAVARAIDEAAISVVGLGQYAVSAGGFLSKEWIAAEKLIGNVGQAADLAGLSFLYLQKLGAMGFLPGTGDLARLAEINAEIKRATTYIAAHGRELKALDGQQAEIDATTARFNETLQDLKDRMAGAKSGTEAFVGPINQLGSAQGRAGQGALGHRDGLVQLDEIAKETAKSQKKLADMMGTIAGVQRESFGTLSTTVLWFTKLGVSSKGYTEGLEKVGETSENTAAKQVAFYESLKAVQEPALQASIGLSGIVKTLQELGEKVDIVAPKFENFMGPIKLMEDMSDTAEEMHDRLTASFRGLPETLMRAFEGGGGLLGAFKSLAVQIGDVFADTLKASLEKASASGVSIANAVSLKASAALGAMSGIGAAAAGASGKAAMGAVAMTAIGVTTTAALATGATVAGVVALGAATLGVGAAAVGAYIAIRKLMNDPEKKVNPIREAFVQAAGGLDALNVRATNAGMTLARVLDAKTPAAYKLAIDELNASFKFQDDAMKLLDDAVKKYGFSLEELGPTLQRQALDQQAQAIFQDFSVLTAGGIEAGAVIRRMADATNDYVKSALTMGVEVPAAMRPMLERMADMGLLTDENGDVITDLKNSGIVFAETMTQGFDRVVKAVNDLVGAITRGLNPAIASVPAVHVPVVYDDPGFTPQSANFNPYAASGGIVTPSGIQAFGGGGRVLAFPSRMGTDSVPAMLSPGEWVVNPDQQQRLASMLFGSESRRSGSTGSGGVSITIPVYLGDRLIDEHVVKVTQRELNNGRITVPARAQVGRGR